MSFTNPDLENGPTNPLSLKRTFGSTAPIRVKLYRDHAAVSSAGSLLHRHWGQWQQRWQQQWMQQKQQR